MGYNPVADIVSLSSFV